MKHSWHTITYIIDILATNGFLNKKIVSKHQLCAWLFGLVDVIATLVMPITYTIVFNIIGKDKAWQGLAAELW